MYICLFMYILNLFYHPDLRFILKIALNFVGLSWCCDSVMESVNNSISCH